MQLLSSLLILGQKSEIPAMFVSKTFHVLTESLLEQQNTKRAAGLRVKLES